MLASFTRPFCSPTKFAYMFAKKPSIHFSLKTKKNSVLKRKNQNERFRRRQFLCNSILVRTSHRVSNIYFLSPLYQSLNLYIPPFPVCSDTAKPSLWIALSIVPFSNLFSHRMRFRRPQCLCNSVLALNQFEFDIFTSCLRFTQLEFKIFRHSLLAPIPPIPRWGSDSFIGHFSYLFYHFRRGERAYAESVAVLFFFNFKMSDEPHLGHEFHANQRSHKPFAANFSILELVHFPRTFCCYAKSLCKSWSAKLSASLHAINLNCLI